MAEEELQRGAPRAHRRRRVALHLLHAQQVRPHLRFVEGRRIALRVLARLAHIAVILLPRGGSEAAQGQRFVEQAQRIVLKNARRRSARGLTGGFVRGHSPRVLPLITAPSTLSSPPIPRDTCVLLRRASGFVQHSPQPTIGPRPRWLTSTLGKILCKPHMKSSWKKEPPVCSAKRLKRSGRSLSAGAVPQDGRLGFGISR